MLGKRPMCNTEISKAMNLPINSITGITNRLVKDDLVEEAYRAPSPQTGVRVIFWKAIKGGQTTLL
jgi:DNA-binding MarR family transcriptional regulator